MGTAPPPGPVCERPCSSGVPFQPIYKSFPNPPQWSVSCPSCSRILSCPNCRAPSQDSSSSAGSRDKLVFSSIDSRGDKTFSYPPLSPYAASSVRSSCGNFPVRRNYCRRPQFAGLPYTHNRTCLGNKGAQQASNCSNQNNHNQNTQNGNYQQQSKNGNYQNNNMKN